MNKAPHRQQNGVKPPVRTDTRDDTITTSEDEQLDLIVTINVGGRRFESTVRTLRAIPHSKLASLTPHHESYRPDKKEYFFDRSEDIFRAVLDYHRTGEFHLPLSICGPAARRELDFWGMHDADIELCCIGHYQSFQSQKTSLYTFSEALKILATDAKPAPNTNFQGRIWNILDHPRSSTLAMVYAIISIMVISMSIFSLILSSHRRFRIGLSLEERALMHGITAQEYRLYKLNLTTPAEKLRVERAMEVREGDTFDTQTKEFHDFIYVDIICQAFFTIEFIVRLVFCPRKLRFLSSMLNVVDFLSLLPPYIKWTVIAIDPGKRHDAAFLHGINAVQVIRVLRLARLTKHYRGMMVIMYTIKASSQEIILTFVFVTMGVLVFGCSIYYAEDTLDSKFTDIPKSFWWAIITMTTVGYGDMYPKSAWGYVIGSTCALSGVMVIALTVPVVVNNFMMFYGHSQIVLAHQERPASRMRRLINKCKKHTDAFTRRNKISATLDGNMSKDCMVVEVQPTRNQPALLNYVPTKEEMKVISKSKHLIESAKLSMVDLSSTARRAQQPKGPGYIPAQRRTIQNASSDAPAETTVIEIQEMTSIQSETENSDENGTNQTQSEKRRKQTVQTQTPQQTRKKPWVH